MRIISGERKIPPQRVDVIRGSGRHSCETEGSQQAVKPAYRVIGRIQWFWCELLQNSWPGSTLDLVQTKVAAPTERDGHPKQ